MKVALYIEDGIEQIILTPESDTERNLLENLHKDRDISVHRNRFYRTVGGFVAQGDPTSKDYSTMLVLTPGSKDSKIKREDME